MQKTIYILAFLFVGCACAYVDYENEKNTITYHAVELTGPLETQKNFFIGPLPKVGDAVELVTTEVQDNKIVLMWRVRQ